MTNEWKAGTRCETEEDLKAELTSGQNIVAAAKKTGVKHMIFSSLPNISKGSSFVILLLVLKILVVEFLDDGCRDDLIKKNLLTAV